MCGVALLRAWPRPRLGAGVPQSAVITAANGELLRVTLAADAQYRIWTPLEQMPARLPKAVVLYEDRWFYWHPGVNPIALLRAAFGNMRGGRRVGASTITMQLARRLYRIDTRSAPGKLRQIAAAMGLELRYSKREILEAYLNLAPYGGNVQGAGAPIVTTSDGRSDPIVWMVGAEGDDRLHGFKGDTGDPLPAADAGVRMTGLQHFQTLIAAKDRLYVSAEGRVYAFAF